MLDWALIFLTKLRFSPRVSFDILTYFGTSYIKWHIVLQNKISLDQAVRQEIEQIIIFINISQYLASTALVR